MMPHSESAQDLSLTTLREKRKHPLCGVNAPVSSNQMGEGWGWLHLLSKEWATQATTMCELETHNQLLVPATQGALLGPKYPS